MVPRPCCLPAALLPFALKMEFHVQALEGIPVERADWILWLDMDLLVDNMNFTFPITKYAGKDVILHGDEDWIKKGDARRGALEGPAM